LLESSSRALTVWNETPSGAPLTGAILTQRPELYAAGELGYRTALEFAYLARKLMPMGADRRQH